MNQSAKQQARRIVVGVDGSTSSLDALRWALSQARATGASVDAVTTWEQQPYAYGAGYYVPVPDSDLAAAVGQVLDESIAQVRDEGTAGIDGTAVEIRPQVLQGQPAQVLIEAARGADLLVVGNRGHGGFTGALLGSVGQHCVQHAPCPVVIVRDEEK